MYEMLRGDGNQVVIMETQQKQSS